jgi:hypothetical protein
MNKETIEILKGMFTENTGEHMLDSGGTPKYDENGKYIGSSNGSGRKHEINRNRDFENEKYSTVSFTEYDIEYHVNTFKWLVDRVTFNEKFDDMFHKKFAKKNKEMSWFEMMHVFPEWLVERGFNVTGVFGEGKPVIINTYNEQNVLDQVLQFCYWEMNGKGYVALQVHGGCDVRGGYTKPRIFSVDEEGGIFNYSHGTITGSDEYHESVTERDGEIYQWTTDDGYNWYGDENDLNKLEIKDIEESGVWEAGKLCVAGGKGYCPMTGQVLK